MNSRLAADLDLAVRAAEAGGRVALRAFRTDQEVRYKSAEQPVTDADLEADRVIREILLGARPGYGWLSEETADSRHRLGGARVWVVDPIDGTSSFVAGRPEFTVAVGLVENGRAVLGVVRQPVTGETYAAAEGCGATRGGVPIRVSRARPEDSGLRLVASRWEAERGGLDAFRPRWRVETLGSTAYKMVKVADGTVDAFVSLGRKGEWDVCAAAVIVAEAGGQASHLDGSPFRYNRPEPEWRGVLASNGGVHPLLVAAIRGLDR